MDIRASINLKSVEKYLTDVQRKQVPFATSNTINDLAFGYRRVIVDDIYPKAFPNRKNIKFPSAGTPFSIMKSNKRTLIAKIYDRLGLSFLATQEKGGTKRPEGSALTIPKEGRVKYTQSGKLTKTYKPRTLIGKKDVFSGRVSGRAAGIYRRKPDGSLEKLFTYAKKAVVPANFRGYTQGLDGYVTKNAGRMFAKNFARAMGTAR